MIIAVNFPIQANGKKEPEKIRALTGLESPASVRIPLKPLFCLALFLCGEIYCGDQSVTFIYNHSSDRNHFGPI